MPLIPPPPMLTCQGESPQFITSEMNFVAPRCVTDRKISMKFSSLTLFLLLFQAAEVYVYMLQHRGSVPSFVSGLPTLLIRYLKLLPSHVFFSHVRQECSEVGNCRLKLVDLKICAVFSFFFSNDIKYLRIVICQCWINH